jgi:hypothetical protein
VVPWTLIWPSLGRECLYHRQCNSAAYVKSDVDTMLYCFFFLDQGTSYRRSCRRNFEKGPFDWNKSEWRATSPAPTPINSQNASNHILR